jgi:hypothetical protein
MWHVLIYLDLVLDTAGLEVFASFDADVVRKKLVIFWRTLEYMKSSVGRLDPFVGRGSKPTHAILTGDFTASMSSCVISVPI